MASIELLDKRLLERKIRQGEMTEADLEQATQGLPDLADNVEPLDEEAITQLSEELVVEQTRRAERIERAVSGEPEAVPEPVTIIPVDFDE